MSFDAVAPWYRTLETIALGNSLQRARVACLTEIGPPRRALILGEGNGRFLVEFRRMYPVVQVDCVDASERMLALARERLGAGNLQGVRFLHYDLRQWTPAPARYDLIVTHFFLDCFPEPELSEVVAKLSRAATPDAAWLLADFAVPEAGLGRLQARLWLPAMYAFFRLIAGIAARQLVNPSPFLRAHGFNLRRAHTFRRGMLKSELWRKGGTRQL